MHSFFRLQHFLRKVASVLQENKNSGAPRLEPYSRALPDGTQAERVIRAFGGVRPLMRALKAVKCPYNPATLYKWTYPYPKGTGGLVPLHARADVMKAAAKAGIQIPLWNS